MEPDEPLASYSSFVPITLTFAHKMSLAEFQIP